MSFWKVWNTLSSISNNTKAMLKFFKGPYSIMPFYPSIILYSRTKEDSIKGIMRIKKYEIAFNIMILEDFEVFHNCLYAPANKWTLESIAFFNRFQKFKKTYNLLQRIVLQNTNFLICTINRPCNMVFYKSSE